MQPKDDDQHLHPQENWKTSIFESDLKLLFELIVCLLLFVVCFNVFFLLWVG